MTRHRQSLDDFEDRFPLANWANRAPAWRWPVILIALLLLWGIVGHVDFNDLHGAAAALGFAGTVTGSTRSAQAPRFGTQPSTVVEFSTDARHADRADRMARQAAQNNSTAHQRAALIAARLDGEEAGLHRGWRRGSRIGFWLGLLFGSASTVVVLQTVTTVHAYGGIGSFVASFVQ